MLTLILATRNPHKVEEIRTILGEGVSCMSLADLKAQPPAVREDASTFEGNVTLKSTQIAAWLAQLGGGVPHDTTHLVLADDSGLEVDALDGAPGVHSARFAAEPGQEENSSDEANNAKLLGLLEGVPWEKRTARFRCVMGLTPIKSRDPNQLARMTVHFEGACEGRIGFEPSGEGGFGYDPLFYPDIHDCSFAELGAEVKNELSHRARALEELRAFLRR